ncbi:MAG: aminotransferase class V-fold PLP-dependent enzyme [Planctomycetes bacterium]|nr:aminotransferase class V-fold PLP-dependent enzyme [Planctomycetota bacterium]
MTVDRRSFLAHGIRLAAVAAAAPVVPLARGAAFDTSTDPIAAARDEARWAPIRACYAPSTRFTNVESGYYSPASAPVLDALEHDQRRINALASWYMRREKEGEHEAVRHELARFMQVDAEEVALVRNTTEALNTVLLGLDLDVGDEIVACEQEYGSMLQVLDQRARRDGVVPIVIEQPPLDDDVDAIVAHYAAALTPRTRVLLVSHIYYLTGRILPVAAIAAMARARGVFVVCDGAHAFAHLDLRPGSLGVDAYAASLHKWLGAPLGNGVLWIRKPHIASIWPLFADADVDVRDIRKFEHYGTHPCANVHGIRTALEFHEAIGGAFKEQRLRYLKDCWAKPLQGEPRLRFNVPLTEAGSCALANVAVEDMTGREASAALLERHGVFTVGVRSGVRIAPNLWLTPSDLEPLLEGLRELARERR